MVLGMANEIIKTVVHLTDEKGWTKTIDHNGDYYCGRTYRLRRRLRLSQEPIPITFLEKSDHPSIENMGCKDYEFTLVDQLIQRIRKNGKKFAKHLYFEMV